MEDNIIADLSVPYPRVCAHRGLPALLPANSLEGLEAAAAAGAQEIEFDLWLARDSRIVVRHNPIAYLSAGKVARLPGLEDVLERLGGRVIMNIHIKAPGAVAGAARSVERFGCRESVYFTGGGAVMKASLDAAPDITRCCLAGDKDFTIVKNAVKYKARKVQFFKPFLNQSMVDEAHAHGMRCNVYYADSVEGARAYFRMGIDTVLTNHCAEVLKATLVN